MGKNKRLKKNIKKKVVKKKINQKQINKKLDDMHEKPLTSDQQAKRNEMLKTMLARMPMGGSMFNPEQMEEARKLQNLIEQNNKMKMEQNRKEAAVKEQQRIKKENQERNIDLKDQQQQFDQQQQAAKAAADNRRAAQDLQFRKDAAEGKNLLGQYQQDIENKRFEMRRITHEIQQKEQRVKENKMFNDLKLAGKELQALIAQNKALDNIIKSNEFQKPEGPYIEHLKKIELEKTRLKHQQEIIENQKDINEIQAKIIAQNKVNEDYKRNKMVQKINEHGKPMWWKAGKTHDPNKPNHMYAQDKSEATAAKAVPVMIEVPNSSQYAQDVEQARRLFIEKANKEAELRKQQEDYNTIQDTRTQIAKANFNINRLDIQNKAQQEINKKAQKDLDKLDAETKQRIQAAAQTETMKRLTADHTKLLEELRKEKEREEFIKQQEQSISLPEYKQQTKRIAQQKQLVENQQKFNDNRESLIKSMKRQKQLEADKDILQNSQVVGDIKASLDAGNALIQLQEKQFEEEKQHKSLDEIYEKQTKDGNNRFNAEHYHLLRRAVYEKVGADFDITATGLMDNETLQRVNQIDKYIIDNASPIAGIGFEGFNGYSKYANQFAEDNLEHLNQLAGIKP